ncbi:MAG: TldD/PmbA family protein [candidate division WOR-3 bacterium]|nr:TldD/PmbA family protein [candidate division WOR-3 bacterium]
MIEKKQAKKIIDFVLKESKADQTEVVIFDFDSALTRYANNYIHQNVHESNTGVSIRVCFGKKIGSSYTNSTEIEKIKETLRWAETIARLQKDNPYFESLPEVSCKSYKGVSYFDARTANMLPKERAEVVKEIISVAKANNLTCFGSVSNGTSTIAIGNSKGVFAYSRSSDIFCNIVMATENSTGYVQAGAKSVKEMNFNRMAKIAADKALKSKDPLELSPGQYTTILEPLAVSDIISYLAYYAFNGKTYEEGRSFLSGKLLTKVVDERVTIIDDPFYKKGFISPFDFEGVPKKRLVLIEKGVAKNVVYDSLTAAMARKKSTGHALMFPNPFGPVPLHIVMKGGDSSLEEMIKKTKKGILLTRLHYTNVIDPYKLTFTGMTRDGTFLIEDGVIVKGIKNLRFTENIFDALNRIESISRDTVFIADEPGYGGRMPRGMTVPALKIRDFTFTSATEF